MTRGAALQLLYDRVIAGDGGETEHRDLAEWLCGKRRLLEAFHVLSLAAERFGNGPAVESLTAEAFGRLEDAGGIESTVASLQDAVADAFAEELEKAREDHGPGAGRPAPRAFILCVAIKNLLSRFRKALPGGLALMRVCDRYGRVAAEQSWGRPARSASIGGGLAHVTVGGCELVYAAHPRDQRNWINFFVLEPGLIRWVSTFGSDDVFLDIGANIGRYSVLAARAARTKTIAVEPFSVNVDALERNIALNGLQDDVTAIRAAIHDVTGDGLLQFSERVAGAADQRFRAGPDTDDPAGAEPLAGYRLDDLVAGGRIAFPTHIKIDVDGGEHRLIDGMAETLRDERLRSIRLEIQLDETGNPAALERIRQAGFDCAVDDDRKNFLCRR